MSLKFGIYLVEQRIVSPEQFCGLVKIQQESTRSLASLAIAHNYLTMKQVSRIIDDVEGDDSRFVETALTRGMMERSDAAHLERLKEQSGDSIRSLAVECGLLTERQCEVLFNHFNRYGSRNIRMEKASVATKPTAPERMPAPKAPLKPNVEQPKPAPSPKFRKRPLIKVEEIQH
jgi:hypothetical protein